MYREDVQAVYSVGDASVISTGDYKSTCSPAGSEFLSGKA